MFNATVVGNLAREPELRQTPNGNDDCNFTLLSNFKDETTTFECSAWGYNAKTAMEYFAVGNQITVTGTAQLNLFEKRDGSTGCSVRINVSSMSIPPKQTNFNKKPALTNEQLPF